MFFVVVVQKIRAMLEIISNIALIFWKNKHPYLLTFWSHIWTDQPSWPKPCHRIVLASTLNSAQTLSNDFFIYRLHPNSRTQLLPKKLKRKWHACASWWFSASSWPGPHMLPLLHGSSSTRELHSQPQPWLSLLSSQRAQHCSTPSSTSSWTNRSVYYYDPANQQLWGQVSSYDLSSWLHAIIV